MELAATDAANEIMELYFELPQAKATFADKQAEKLEQLRRENRENTARILEQARRQAEEKLTKLKSRYEARDSEARERRNAQAPVSYTHLDVYKRQDGYDLEPERITRGNQRYPGGARRGRRELERRL